MREQLYTFKEVANDIAKKLSKQYGHTITANELTEMLRNEDMITKEGLATEQAVEFIETFKIVDKGFWKQLFSFK